MYPSPVSPRGNGYIEMIKQGPSTDTYRYSNKAGLKIIDGTAYDKNGTVVNLILRRATIPVRTTSFFDKRENRTVTVRQVDMTKLQNCTSAKNALNNPPTGEDPGILYVQKPLLMVDSSKAVRLINGSDLTLNNALPSGLMVATDNPLYIKGNYNTSNSRPAAIAADAITFLSNAWNATDDSTHSYQSNLDNRIASQYHGQCRHYDRECPHQRLQLQRRTGEFSQVHGKLDGQKLLIYGGSLVCLWKSERATGQLGLWNPIFILVPNRTMVL